MERAKWVGRAVVSLGFVGIAAYCVWAYATMPYELVTTTHTITKAVPSGDGLIALAFLSAIAALVAAFSGDWG